MSFVRYLISSTDIFNGNDYPEIKTDLAALALEIAFVPGLDKVKATVAFLKTHSMESRFVNDHPMFVDVIRFRSVNTGRIESLFEACRNNEVFLDKFEKFVYDGLIKQAVKS